MNMALCNKFQSDAMRILNQLMKDTFLSMMPFGVYGVELAHVGCHLSSHWLLKIMKSSGWRTCT